MAERSNDYSTGHDNGMEFICNRWVFTGPQGYRVVPNPDGDGFLVMRYDASEVHPAGYRLEPMTEDDAHAHAARLAAR